MGRLSNPPEHLKHLVERDVTGAARGAKHRSRGSGDIPAVARAVTAEETGRLSNPTPRPVQRRLRPPEIATVAADYRAGRSLRDIADTLGVHHRTIAARLQQLGIPRRVNERKLSPEDIFDASRRYEQGASLTTLAAGFNVDAATIRRELRRAGATIRPRRGWPNSVPSSFQR